MKEGLDRNSGHDWERITCKGKDWRDKRWDFDKKVFIDDGPAKFTHCRLCNQFFWAAEAICPRKTIKVPVDARIYV